MEEILVNKKRIIDNLVQDLDKLFQKVKEIFVRQENPSVEIIEKGLSLLAQVKTNSDNNTGISNLLIVYNDNANINLILSIIQQNLNKLLDKRINVETFLSQTYIDETREYNAKVQAVFVQVQDQIKELDGKLLEIISMGLLDHITAKLENIVENFDSFSQSIEKVQEYGILYENVANKLLDRLKANGSGEIEKKDIINHILYIIETQKTNIISKGKAFNYSNNNPALKTFGLIPVSDVTSIQNITKIIFNKAIPSVETLVKVCKDKDIDLLIIKKYLGKGLRYNFLHLLNPIESKKYDGENKQDDGINIDTIERYSTLEFIETTESKVSKAVKWNISYELLVEDVDHQKILILEELYPEQFHILSNTLRASQKDHSPLVDKIDIKELIHFAKTKNYNSTRVGSYNSIVNKKILSNMFLSTKVDIQHIKTKSQLIDPKYLTNTIYISLITKYKELSQGTIKSAYDFSKLSHNPEFAEIFSTIIMNEYYKYLFKNTAIYDSEHIPMSEIYMSFLYVMSIYQRDFIKKMHDTLVMNLPKKEIFSESNHKDILEQIFIDNVTSVLKSIITTESNLFQSILYKLSLFKLSILD